MIVVSNTSPLIFLSSIDMLELLNHEFGEVLIPDAVYREFTIYEEMVKPWIKTKKISDNLFATVLTATLGDGEAEVIVLAKEKKADLLLMDDLAGRRLAKAYGLNVIGTVGFLKVMHKKGRIKEFKSVLDSLIDNGLWIDDALRTKLLED